ncbi:MAG: hypothetical protein UV26_C0016G0003 [candidate division WWE3 bacterium GW2011_GWF2_42_42]|uniref:Uncharacterized protein n=1 Tax=candidate division WWE3 bacterium GW2011_GWF2_42_42 TaxID=1619142 RepID=A0A0G1DC54_UNCKA|nr:MAG: hypothetical protein UV26_C0016G0003 [candidate division WWE3 bacterium GW2011_GWF2_42_42]
MSKATRTRQETKKITYNSHLSATHRELGGLFVSLHVGQDTKNIRRSKES